MQVFLTKGKKYIVLIIGKKKRTKRIFDVAIVYRHKRLPKRNDILIEIELFGD